MTYIIAIANQKGGVGKTTTAAALGAALQDRGASVLLIDLDPQGSLTSALGMADPDLPPALADAVLAYIGGADWPPAEELVTVLPGGEALVPATIELAASEWALVPAEQREQVVRSLVAHIAPEGAYDWVLIDCPPSLGPLTMNALTAADAVLIPVAPEYMAVRGLGAFLQTLRRVQGTRRRPGLNPQLQIAGVVITRIERTTQHQRQYTTVLEAAAQLDIPVLATIPARTAVQNAAEAGVAPTRYPDTNGAGSAYQALAGQVEAMVRVHA